MSKLKTASVLSFERKLANSDALMYAGNWEQRNDSGSWKPIKVEEKAVRGTISNRLKSNIATNPAKLDAEVQKANLQRVDVAQLAADSDTLKIAFTLRVLGDLATPSTCNDAEYQTALSNMINGYIADNQFTELAGRYAQNLANGRFLWRNRVGLEALEVKVTAKQKDEETSWIFDGLDFGLRSFDQPQGDLAKLATIIESGLKGEGYVLLTVEAFARMGAGQEVFPSQELVLDSKDTKSKFLYQVDGIAAMHSQKIGNALRTIDTWYEGVEEVGAIAVEPYGSVTNRGKAYRQPKMDFYTLLDNWVLKDKAPELEQQHYVIATLIRGGVFGEAG